MRIPTFVNDDDPPQLYARGLLARLGVFVLGCLLLLLDTPRPHISPRSHAVLDAQIQRSDSLPAYGDTSYGDSRKPLSQYSPSRGADEAEKGDLGYSDPFVDVFAVDGLDYADSLLADSDLFPPTRHSPPLLETPSPPTTQSVPLYRVFARKAEPLVLPGLDDVIDALGGAAQFTPMPALGDEGMAAKRESKLGETERSDAFEMTATGGKLTRRSAEWQGWERWVRDGPPQSCWSCFVNAVLPFSRRRPLRINRPFARRSSARSPSHDSAVQAQSHPSSLPSPAAQSDRDRPRGESSTPGSARDGSNGAQYCREWDLGCGGEQQGHQLDYTLRIVTLLVSSSGSPLLPSARTTEPLPPPGVLRAVFVTVLAFLSLDLVSAFGNALIFVLVLTLFTFAALYKCMRFTGGWRGPKSRRTHDTFDLSPIVGDFPIHLVFIVVVMQKHNCVFRRFATTYLSVIRQGCLLAFLSLYSLFAMKTLPYLDIPSNSSDVSSHIVYSLLAMLGLLAALGFPKTDPAQLAVNIVLYSLSIYFVVIGTPWAQGWVKKVQRRLDFSIDIFSPSLNLNKHINRRVWQETLATIFLCSPGFAMPARHSLVYAEEVSPHLLGFTGSPAERLVENLNASPFLWLPKQLRETILERLLGPDRYYNPVESTTRIRSHFGRVDVVPFPFTVIFRYDDSPAHPLHLVTLHELELLVSQNSSADFLAVRRVRLALRALEGQVVFAPHT
ncbi:hypothetical protein RHOSPDRAFT_26670 [Rhodotorula sp. JG-1b]|nr:hypothetical protein RHOSPDRAFT_26670 [Rhodotorula sp. JG-1b]